MQKLCISPTGVSFALPLPSEAASSVASSASLSSASEATSSEAAAAASLAADLLPLPAQGQETNSRMDSSPVSSRPEAPHKGCDARIGMHQGEVLASGCT